nr:HGGxSTG domain-containing protein [Nordella sp. HKS 07]
MKADGRANIERWKFGPDWPGRRCSARTRSGKQCQKPALKGKKRCQLHGGKSTGAPTGANNGNWKHGQFTKEVLQRQHRDRAVLQLLRTMWPLIAKLQGGTATTADVRNLRRLEAIFDNYE